MYCCHLFYHFLSFILRVSFILAFGAVGLRSFRLEDVFRAIKLRFEPGVKLGLNLVFNLFNLDFTWLEQELSFIIVVIAILKIIIVMSIIISFRVLGKKSVRARLNKKAEDRGGRSPRGGVGGAESLQNDSNTCRILICSNSTGRRSDSRSRM